MKNGIQVCVPASALASEGEDAVTPGMGDAVSLSIEGTVNKAAGGLVWITPTAVNGQPVEAEADEAVAENPRAAMERELSASYG